MQGGELLAGRFRIGPLLGAGGMGQVWAAQDERMRRDVAVKVVHPQYGMDESETQARFQREVQLAGRLSHQNIVTVHDWGEVSVNGRQTLFLVMELVHGVPLHRQLNESTPPWTLAVGWSAQIAEALHAAHSQGVVHRDIKPANVLLTPSGRVKVLDFGVAKFMGETIGARELTVTGAPLGSPPYMSPEQAVGARAIDHRSDLYSLGCLLYHAVTGRPPFISDVQWAVLRMQMEDTPVAPSSLVAGLPGGLDDLLMSLLAKDPDSRPQDAAVVHDALGTLLFEHAVALPDSKPLDALGPGHGDSLAGRLLTKAWEVWERAEGEGASVRAEAEGLLRAARADAEQLLQEARVDADRVRLARLTDGNDELARLAAANDALLAENDAALARIQAEHERLVASVRAREASGRTGSEPQPAVPAPLLLPAGDAAQAMDTSDREFRITRRGYSVEEVHERIAMITADGNRALRRAAVVEAAITEMVPETAAGLIADAVDRAGVTVAFATAHLKQWRGANDVHGFAVVKKGYDQSTVNWYMSDLMYNYEEALRRLSAVDQLYDELTAGGHQGQ
ncbi:protein kinase [Streptomyces sp. GESEQ-4]|uniref:serine/threonine-protein kinase n=1 Tax=Streptomyces sp. GESEQ-4 TaxID=2812655 RepID=UPI0027DD6E29|nr:protein kinase [Streptomyces sp. GESEQ-4]